MAGKKKAGTDPAKTKETGADAGLPEDVAAQDDTSETLDAAEHPPEDSAKEAGAEPVAPETEPVDEPPREAPGPEAGESEARDESAPEQDATDSPEAGDGPPDETPDMMPQPEAVAETEPAAQDVEASQDGASASPDDTGAASETAKDAPEARADVPGAIFARTNETVRTAAPITRTERVTIRQGGFWSMLFGGVVAAGIGVVAAPFILPPAWFAPANDQQISSLDEAVSTQQAQLDELSDTVAGLGEAPPDASGEIDGLRDGLTGLTERMSAMEDRIASLEQRPVAGDDGAPRAAVESLRAALEAQAEEVANLRAEADAREAAARDTAQATLRRAALTRITTALDTGSAFADALNDLRDTGAEIPAALSDAAESGVPTISGLSESFPDAARAALAAARAAQETPGDGLASLFRSELGLRSLTPREGNDPDAVLSRAEAALRAGKLDEALAELDLLPEPAQAAIGDWHAAATRRKEALAAAETVAATLN